MTTETDTSPATDSQGTAPAEPAAPVDTTPATEPADGGVQPSADAKTQPDGGQGLIAPYLEGVDEAHRDAVADVLERYRKDSDAEIGTKLEALSRFQQYADDPSYLETPVALYENLMQSPLDTVQFILEQFETEAGINLKAQLLEALNTPDEPDPQADPETDPKDKPLTVAEWERLQEQKAQEERQAAEAQRRRELTKGWLDEAAETAGLELTDEDTGLRRAILEHAAQVMPKFKHLGEQAGQKAIQTAVEAFVNRFGNTPPGNPGGEGNEPVTANGGTPPAPEQSDLSDPSARKAFMKQALAALQTQE